MKTRKLMNDKRVKPHLTFKILMIIVIFILPVNLIFGWVSQRSIWKMEENIRRSLQNVTNVYMDALDNDMKRIDYYLYSSYFSNADFLTLMNTKDELKYESAKYKCIQNMRDEIYLSLNCEVLFYYHIKRNEYIMSCGEGAEKEKFCSFLDNNTDFETKWTMVEVEGKNYLLHVTKKGRVYYGGFINLDEFVKNVSEAVKYESARVIVLKMGETIETNDMIVASKESNYADANLWVSVATQEIFLAFSAWEWGLAVIAILFLGLIPLMYMIMKKWVLSPLKELNYAQHELKIGNEKYRITKEGNSAEFSEVYCSFNEMADNIYNLKIENMEKELAAKQLELSNLQLQIRPHFLLNTFNLIYNLASEKDVDNVKELILYLSGYFRHIFRSGKELEMFQKELVLIDGYMKAAKLRYPERLDIHYQIDPEVLMVRVPPLLVHNFIENVVKHALVKDRVICIVLAAEYTDGEVTFIVSDNGAGMGEEEVRMINGEHFIESEKQVFVGLRNSAMRLKYFYGEKAKIRVESERNYGTVFTITFPYNLEEE